MSNTIFITANWTTGALSQQTISRQYDNNRYAVQFIGYPEGDGTEELDLYLLVWMSTAPGQKPGEITPIQLNSDQWYISNYFTQQVQVIKFQLCVLNEAGTYEAHSPIFSGRIGDSLEHDGTSQDIDVSTLFDAYREYLNELIIGAGAVIIDPVPTQGSTNAVSSGGVYDALDTLQAQIPQIDSTLSQSGQAADALETGKIKAELYNSEIFNVSDWENGSITASTGANTNHSSRIRTKSYLPWGIKKLYSTNTNVRFLVYAYKNGAYVGGWWNDGTFNPSDVKGVTSVDFDVFYRNPDFEGYQYRACIYINSGTARVETISGVLEEILPISEFVNINANLSVNRVKYMPDGTDFDDLTGAGTYIINNSASIATMLNRPLFAATGGRLFVLQTTSASLPMQLYIGYNSTGSPVIYTRYKKTSGWFAWQRVGGHPARNIRVLGFNLGKFNYGRDGGLAEHVEEKIANFKRFIGNINPDIALTCECATYIDSSETYQTIPTIFTPLYNKYASFNECAVFADAFDSAKLESDCGIYLRDNLNAYAGQVARQVIEIDGKQLLMSGGFLRVLGTAQERYEAFVNYLASISDYDYSIIYLDTNVLSEEERVNIANAATAAGYTICNGGYFGLFPTLNTQSMFRPIDNIFVKGNIKVKNFEVASDEYDNLSSDHYAVIADLSIY